MLFVLQSSSCCKDIPRIRRSTSVSTGSVSQSCLVVLEGFSSPRPGRDPVLVHIRSRVLDLFRGFVFACAILHLAVAVRCRLGTPGRVAPLGFVVLIGLGLVADSGLVLWSLRAVPGRFLVALGGSCADADVPSVDADSSLRRCLRDADAVNLPLL